MGDAWFQLKLRSREKIAKLKEWDKGDLETGKGSNFRRNPRKRRGKEGDTLGVDWRREDSKKRKKVVACLLGCCCYKLQLHALDHFTFTFQPSQLLLISPDTHDKNPERGTSHSDTLEN